MAQVRIAIEIRRQAAALRELGRPVDPTAAAMLDALTQIGETFADPGPRFARLPDPDPDLEASARQALALIADELRQSAAGLRECWSHGPDRCPTADLLADLAVGFNHLATFGTAEQTGW